MDRVDFDDFYNALSRAKYYLNDLDSLDLVGLVPLWYRLNFSEKVRSLLLDIYRLSINRELLNVEEDEKED